MMTDILSDKLTADHLIAAVTVPSWIPSGSDVYISPSNGGPPLNP
jgi:hypothetical protein